MKATVALIEPLLIFWSPIMKIFSFYNQYKVLAKKHGPNVVPLRMCICLLVLIWQQFHKIELSQNSPDNAVYDVCLCVNTECLLFISRRDHKIQHCLQALTRYFEDKGHTATVFNDSFTWRIRIEACNLPEELSLFLWDAGALKSH